MSSNDQRLHFGFGLATQVDKVEIHWPDGAAGNRHTTQRRSLLCH